MPEEPKDSAHDWDCYMITGLGGMCHWDSVCVEVAGGV